MAAICKKYDANAVCLIIAPTLKNGETTKIFLYPADIGLSQPRVFFVLIIKNNYNDKQ